jgi:hypothetical protein
LLFCLVVLRKKNIAIVKKIRAVLSVVSHIADDLKYGDINIKIDNKIAAFSFLNMIFMFL